VNARIANDAEHALHRVCAGLDVHTDLSADADVVDASDTVDTLAAPVLKASLAASLVTENDPSNASSATTTATGADAQTSSAPPISAGDKLKSIMASLKREATALVTVSHANDDDDDGTHAATASHETDTKKVPKWLKMNKKK
jgi:hypothetical protein